MTTPVKEANLHMLLANALMHAEEKIRADERERCAKRLEQRANRAFLIGEPHVDIRRELINAAKDLRTSERPEQTVAAFGKEWRRLWQEDECLLRDPDAEHIEGAWKRLIGTEYPGTARFAHEDWGDAGAFHVAGKLVVSSFDGYSLWEEIT
jgi:hypothetical protein